MIRVVALLVACAIAAPSAQSGLQPLVSAAVALPEYKPGALAYSPLARPICATADELGIRLVWYGLTSEARVGLQEPVRSMMPAFVEEWSDGEYAALVQGDRRRACIVGVGKTIR